MGIGKDLLAEERDDDIVCPDAIGLDDIVNEDGAIVFIAMESANIRVDADFNKDSFDFAIEHAIGIIKEGIGEIESGVLRAGGELVLLGKEGREGFEIDFGGGSFPSTELRGNISKGGGRSGAKFEQYLFLTTDGSRNTELETRIGGLECEQKGLLMEYFLTDDLFNPLHSIRG